MLPPPAGRLKQRSESSFRANRVSARLEKRQRVRWCLRASLSPSYDERLSQSPHPFRQHDGDKVVVIPCVVHLRGEALLHRRPHRFVNALSIPRKGYTKQIPPSMAPSLIIITSTSVTESPTPHHGRSTCWSRTHPSRTKRTMRITHAHLYMRKLLVIGPSPHTSDACRG